MSDQEFTSSYQVVMPRLGLTMVEGKIIEWYKNDGDMVNKGDPLFSIENEKATLDIESPASGKLAIQVEPDIVVPVLSPVGLIYTKEKGSTHHAGSKETQAEQVVANALTEKQTDHVVSEKSYDQLRITPRARKAAREAGLDLSQVQGSGIRGMIVTSDLPEKTVAEKPMVKATPVAKRVAAEAGVDLTEVTGTGPRGMVRKEDVERCVKTIPAPAEPMAPVPLTGLRKVISERLGKSWSERPHSNLTTEVDASLFVKARNQINQELSKKGIKVSYNTLLIKLAAQALQEFPFMNVSLIPDGFVQHTQINVGLAVDTERGLMVPVVKDANFKNFECIQEDLDGVIKRSQSGTATWDDVSGGTFTISNLGAFDIDGFTPLINPPECAILGIGRIHQKPVVVDGQVVIHDMMVLSISFDHRLVDGAPAARFLQRIKQFIEQPFLWSLWDR